jgi:RimJ/RimL family protein N-acetyltransferase
MKLSLIKAIIDAALLQEIRICEVKQMKYEQRITLKNGNEAWLRNGNAPDGNAVFDIFNTTHAETDYLLSYPDENCFDPEQEAHFLEEKTRSPNEIEIIAFIDGKIAGIAGIGAVGTKYKVKHRAEFGISILKEYWGLGLGRALTEACIQCARDAGYVQMELNVVSENKRAISLYQNLGFAEFGRNPKGFLSRTSGFQELIYMLLEL